MPKKLPGGQNKYADNKADQQNGGCLVHERQRTTILLECEGMMDGILVT